MLDLVWKLLDWRALGNYYSILLYILFIFSIFWCCLIRKTQGPVSPQMHCWLSMTATVHKEMWVQCNSTIVHFNKLNEDIQLLILLKASNQKESQICLKVLISSRLYPLTVSLLESDKFILHKTRHKSWNSCILPIQILQSSLRSFKKQ